MTPWQVRRIGLFRFRDMSCKFRRPRWVIEHDFIIGAYDLSTAALAAIVARFETYWSTRKLPKTAWNAFSPTSLRFEIDMADRAKTLATEWYSQMTKLGLEDLPAVEAVHLQERRKLAQDRLDAAAAAAVRGAGAGAAALQSRAARGGSGRHSDIS